MSKNYYVDIDGTMTNTPGKRWGSPNLLVIEKVKTLIKDNIVIIWTAGGCQYAKDFCAKYDLIPAAILPKPDYIIDDISTIRKAGKIEYITPKDFVYEPYQFDYKNFEIIIKVIDKNSPYYDMIGSVVDCESMEYYDTKFVDGQIVTIERSNLEFINFIDHKNKQSCNFIGNKLGGVKND